MCNYNNLTRLNILTHIYSRHTLIKSTKIPSDVWRWISCSAKERYHPLILFTNVSWKHNVWDDWTNRLSYQTMHPSISSVGTLLLKALSVHDFIVHLTLKLIHQTLSKTHQFVGLNIYFGRKALDMLQNMTMSSPDQVVRKKD